MRTTNDLRHLFDKTDAGTWLPDGTRRNADGKVAERPWTDGEANKQFCAYVHEIMPDLLKVLDEFEVLVREARSTNRMSRDSINALEELRARLF